MDETTPTPASGDASVLDRIEAFLAPEGDETTTTAEGKPEGSGATKTEKPAGDAPDKTDEPQFTASHLAQYLGLEDSAIDVDEDGAPVFKMKIDGKEENRKFKDLVETYQKAGHAETRMREAPQNPRPPPPKMQEAEQAIAQRHEAAQRQLGDVAQLTQLAQAELAHDYNQINWTQLAQENPGQAMALKEHFQQKAGRIQSILQNITARQQHAAAQADHARRANEAKSAETQAKRLQQLIPEWKDVSVFQKERAEILSWVERSGLDLSDLDLNKASQVHLLRRSWQQADLQSTKPEIEKKLRDAPKLVKPGTAQVKTGKEANAAQLNDLKRQARTTGRGSQKATEAWLLAKGIA